MKKAMVNLHAVNVTTGQLTTGVVVRSNSHEFRSRFSTCEFDPLSFERFKRIAKKCMTI